MNINNKKGFVMAEVIIVSAIVVVTLTTLFTSYNKVYMIYRQRVNYYDTVSLYRLAYYRDILIENQVIDSALANAKNDSSKVIDIYDSTNGINSLFSLPDTETISDVNDRVLLIYNNKQNLLANSIDSKNGIHATFKDYIKYLSTSADLTKTNYVMVIERCNENNQNDCKYAYLEVLDGNE